MHIDHLQKDPDLAYVAPETGYTLVELDFFKQPTSDRTEAVRMNIAKCFPIIEDMHALGISVEVEEGEIGSTAARAVQTREEIGAEITKVEDVLLLVEGTNPETLAIFIGAAHGEIVGEQPIFRFSCFSHNVDANAKFGDADEGRLGGLLVNTYVNADASLDSAKRLLAS